MRAAWVVRGPGRFAVISVRNTWRMASWWRSTMISMSLERPDRTVRRANDARKRYKMRYTLLRIGAHLPWSQLTSEFRAPTGSIRAKVPALRATDSEGRGRSFSGDPTTVSP